MKEFVDQVKTGNVNIINHIKKALNEAHELDQTHHFFTYIADEQALEQAAKLQVKIDSNEDIGPLAGVVVTVKDGICVQGMPSASSSKIIRDYRPLFDATAIKRLKDADAIVIGKTVQDEFGFGGFCTNCADDLIPPKNANDITRACGGSSGGAGGIARAFSIPHIAVGESTGGSIVNPASFCGVVGLCPTYGRVSRYGLIDYANSLDKIGPLTKNVKDAALAIQIMQGFDINDSTSSNKEDTYDLTKNPRGMTVGILSFKEKDIDPRIRELVKQAQTTLEHCGIATKEVTLPLTEKHALAVYYLLALTEASTNLAKFCGLRYGSSLPLEGSYNEYFSKVRTQNFGEEAIRRILIGTFARMAGYRDAYYTKASKIRTLIIDEYKDAFRDVDVLVCPTMAIIAPKFEEIDQLSISQHYTIDQLTTGPNLAGLPHISVPIGTADNMPVGLTLIGKHFREQDILLLGSVLE
ncbi:MAG: amidase family protein [Candidatus Nanoarchaeia archaeon]